MILIQSLFINYIVLFIFFEIGNIFSIKFSLKKIYEKILFGFSIFVISNFLFYFIFFLSIKFIIYLWIVTIFFIFIINIIYNKKIFLGDVIINISKFIIPITVIYCLIPIFYNEQFYVFRGNHWDLFSYLSVASLFNDVKFNDLSNGYLPSFYYHFENIENIAFSRPITSYLLGMFLNLKSTNIYLLVYLFKLIFVILSSISIYNFLHKFKINKLSSYLLSIIFSFSFWLIYVFEIDALSHLVSIPLFILVISEVINFNDKLKLKNNFYIIYFAIINSALFIIYPEIFVISLLIITSCLISEVFKNQLNTKNYIYFVLKCSTIFFIITLFAYKTNYQFIYQQSLSVISQSKDWWGYFGSFILGKENLVLEDIFVNDLKLLLSKYNFFETIAFIHQSHIQNNYNFYYLNILPSLFGLYYIAVGKILDLYNYIELIIVLSLQVYLIRRTIKNSFIILKEKKIFYSFVCIIVLSILLLINKKIWTLIKIYFYVSPFIFLFIASNFTLSKSKISLKINKFVVLLILIFPIYKYTYYNDGIGNLDSFPSIMHPEMKTNFNWELKKESLKQCSYIYVYVNDYFKKSYLILKLLNYKIKNSLTDNINKDFNDNCYLVDNKKYFEIF